MGFKLDDYFEGYEPEESRKPEAKREEEEPRKPKPEEEEYADVFIESRGQRRRRFRKWLLLILFVLAFAVGLYFWLLSASASDGHLRGYVVKIEQRKGILFDSYEGILVADYPDRTDTITQIVYPFSTRNEALGQRLTATMATDSAVVITYDRYRTALLYSNAGSSEKTVVKQGVLFSSFVVLDGKNGKFFKKFSERKEHGCTDKVERRMHNSYSGLVDIT